MIAASRSAWPGCSSRASRSCPAQKDRPAPVRTRQCTVMFCSSAARCSSRMSSSCGVSALSLFGRFRVRVATPSETSRRTRASELVGALLALSELDTWVLLGVGGQDPQVVIGAAEGVFDGGESGGVVPGGVFVGQADAAVQLDRLLRDVACGAADLQLGA